MRRLMARAGLGLALLIPCLSGCNQVPGLRTGTTPAPTANQPDRKPDVPSLVNYLNQNAQRVQNVRAKVDIDCKQGRQAVGLGGNLACQKPRDFRLKAAVLGKPAVDIGSNNDEFWYWISQANPPYVYHCAYRDLSTGKVNLPFPFHPEMVVAAMGIADYDPRGKYELKEYPKTLELIEDATAPSGQAIRRVTVFNRHLSSPGQPQVLGHMLQDSRGQLICRASVQRVQVDRTTGAVLPTVVTIEWPAQELSMKLMLSDLQANALDNTQTTRLFQRTDLTGHEAYDIARGAIDTPGGLRRAGASVLPRR